MAGAGFIIFRKFPSGIKFLGLVGPLFHRNRCFGTYDIPKGVMDFGETAIQTAVREAQEEAGYTITTNNIFAGPFKDGLLTIWMAQVYDDPIISPNPHSGIIEHEGYSWMSPEELLSNSYNYLRPAINWACKMISND